MPVAVTNVAPKKTATSSQSQTDPTTSKTVDKRLGKVPTKPNNVSLVQKTKPGPASSKAATPNRSRKGTNDPVGQFNRFGALDDQGADNDDDDGDEAMEYQHFMSKSSSPKKKN